MRSALIGLLLGCAIVFAACDPAAAITYDNLTGQRLCVYESYRRSAPSATGERGCNEVAPNEKLTYGHGPCSGDDPVWILITVGPGGKHIYSRFATCEEWDGEAVTIEQRGDEFAVTDSLPDGTPSP
jgi:hypothetical protein